jgi:plasmid stabilization system protein ParE
MKAGSVVFRRRAREEFDAAGDWYERERPGLGRQFSDEIDNLLGRLVETPSLFPVVHRDIRRAVVRRFPYCVYFRVREGRVVILGVMHTARRPGDWQGRH